MSREDRPDPGDTAQALPRRVRRQKNAGQLGDALDSQRTVVDRKLGTKGRYNRDRPPTATQRPVYEALHPTEWRHVNEIAKRCGLGREATRGRLYGLKNNGHAENEGGNWRRQISRP